MKGHRMKFGVDLTDRQILALKMGVTQCFASMYRLSIEETIELFLRYNAYDYIDRNAGLLVMHPYEYIAEDVCRSLSLPVSP